MTGTRTGAVIALLLAAPALAGCSGTASHGSAQTTAGSRPGVTQLPTPAGTGEVHLLAPPEQGAGMEPTFSWQPVTGADRYQLFVRDAHAQPIWAWQGGTTSVRLGGLSIDRPSGVAGPRVVPGSSWLVLAVDGTGKVRAASVVRPVSP